MTTVGVGDLSEAGNCTALEKSSGLEQARGSKQPLPGARPFQNGFPSRMENVMSWITLQAGKADWLEKSLAGNDSWLEQGLCKCKTELGHNT